MEIKKPRCGANYQNQFRTSFSTAPSLPLHLPHPGMSEHFRKRYSGKIEKAESNDPVRFVYPQPASRQLLSAYHFCRDPESGNRQDRGGKNKQQVEQHTRCPRGDDQIFFLAGRRLADQDTKQPITHHPPESPQWPPLLERKSKAPDKQRVKYTKPDKRKTFLQTRCVAYHN